MEAVAKKMIVRRLQAFKEITKTCAIDDIITHMMTDRVFKEEDKQAIISSLDRQEELFIRLEKAKKAEKISILDYHWQLLPWIEVELVIVTDNGIHRYIHKE